MFKFLSAIIGGVAKIVAWILVKLGLWVPGLFALAFLIVSAITDTPFASVEVIFYIGLVITTVFALIITFLSAFSKFKKKTEKRASQETESVSAQPKKKEKKVKLIEGAQSNEPVIEKVEENEPQQPVQPAPQQPPTYAQPASQYPQNGYYPPQQGYYSQQPTQQNGFYQQYQPYATPTAPAQPPEQPNENGFMRYNSPTTPPRTDYERSSRFDEIDSQVSERNGFMRYSSPTDGFVRFTADEKDETPKESFRSTFTEPERVMATPKSEVKPKIFRTRMDANLLIYEYPDRLDFYEITPNGRVLRSSEPKK